MDRNVETLTVLARRKPVGDLDEEEADTHQALRSVVRPDTADTVELEWQAEIESRLSHERLQESEVELDHKRGICWLWFRFQDRPSFTRSLLRDISQVQNALIGAANALQSPKLPLKYFVLASRHEGIWNLGGDLRLFSDFVRRQDRQGLQDYAHKAIEEVYANWTSLDLPIITVSLVQGDALGGGLEAALSSNIVIAEKSARFGLPEILFNLFPGMGAYSLLARRATPSIAQRMITSGRIYTGEELYELGVVDLLAEDGKGEDAFNAFVAKNRRRHSALRAISETRQKFHALTMEELRFVADLWTDTILGASDKDLRKMERLAAAQDRRRKRLETG